MLSLKICRYMIRKLLSCYRAGIPWAFSNSTVDQCAHYCAAWPLIHLRISQLLSLSIVPVQWARMHTITMPIVRTVANQSNQSTPNSLTCCKKFWATPTDLLFIKNKLWRSPRRLLASHLAAQIYYVRRWVRRIKRSLIRSMCLLKRA